VKALRDSSANGNPANIRSIYSGGALGNLFGDPATNDRTPDIIIQPIPGTIYSTSHAKVAEHGGLAADDLNVALVVVHGGHNPRPGRIFGGNVDTAQIAPTILTSLGLDPILLDAVKAEHTGPLPGI
jgi:hypothetical protein